MGERTVMKPMFVLCAHCQFPVVVHPVEAGLPRRCRQCREEFVPGDMARSATPSEKRSDLFTSAKNTLRAALRQRRRSLT